MNSKYVLVVSLVCTIAAGCQRASQPMLSPEPTPVKPAELASEDSIQETGMFAIATEPFGETQDGQAVSLFTCSVPSGMVMKLTNYGATITSVQVPDAKGALTEVTLGFDSLAGYQGHTAYFGCAVGRFANRIAMGKFVLDGTEVQLATNHGVHHLHGGDRGFNRVVWSAEPIKTEELVGARFRYLSPDGEENYPGNMTVTAEYTLSGKQELTIRYTAETDRPTVLNLTNHAYWNLAGAGSGTILDHELMIHSEQVLAVGEDVIPTGELADVAGTALDFRNPYRIGERLSQVPHDEGLPAGYDHCYVLRVDAMRLPLAARVRDPQSGRVMEVYTTQPGVQLYTSNYLSGHEENGGYPQHAAFCLETQHFPDSPNHVLFPTTVLRPGETFDETTVYNFSSE